MEQQSRRHGKGKPMEDDADLLRLFGVLDTLGAIARAMHPSRLDALIEKLDDQDLNVADAGSPGGLAAQACAALRAAPAADNPMQQAYRALRYYSRSLEALAGLADTVPAVGRYFLEPAKRDDPALQQRLANPPHPESGEFNFCNEIAQRGGHSVYVPSWYDASRPAPVIMALHGGSGHGRLFLWNWVAEARSRGLIVIAPTAVGSTWSLMEPDIDSSNLGAILDQVRARWAIDPEHMLLTGMSDGGTFTLLSGLADDSPFTHLAPVAASFHPLLLAMTSPERLTGLPIHLTHGSLDWMFPVSVARTAHRTLAAAGAAVTYREITDLSHAYPRDGQGAVLDWWLGQPS
jgi:phospholipase/carboxylesterase